MPTTVKCPACETVHLVPKESQGTHKQCERCGATFTVEIHLDETSVPPEPKPQPSAAGVPASERHSPPAAKPATLGHYVLKRKLGEGGMGEVYLAYDPNLDRAVAIKVLPPAFSVDKHCVERFLREARSAAKLHHTNVATVYQIGTEGKLIYIAMEYVEGRSLDKCVSLEKPMRWREATAVIRDAAAALEVAHEMGLVHRDIKPSNLIRTESGVTKVVDFGLARAASDTNVTEHGRIMGTPAYMSPEQWTGKETDGRSDLYSLICTYYYLLTGKPPYEADSMVAFGYQHRYEPFPDARRLVPDLPAAVCRVLWKGAQKEPARRYQTAAQLIAALDGLEFSALAESDQPEVVPVLPAVGPAARLAAAGPPIRVPLSTPTRDIWPDVFTGRSARRSRRRRPRSRIPKWPPIVAAAICALFLLLSILYLTDNGTIRLDFVDARGNKIDIRGHDVDVKIDGYTIENKLLGEPLGYSADEHQLVVTSTEFQTFTTPFTVSRGQEDVIRVTLKPKPEPTAEGPPPPGEPEGAAGSTEPAK